VLHQTRGGHAVGGHRPADWGWMLMGRRWLITVQSTNRYLWTMEKFLLIVAGERPMFTSLQQTSCHLYYFFTSFYSTGWCKLFILEFCVGVVYSRNYVSSHDIYIYIC